MQNNQTGVQKAVEKGLDDVKKGRTSAKETKERLELKQIPDSWDDFFDSEEQVTPDFMSQRLQPDP